MLEQSGEDDWDLKSIIFCGICHSSHKEGDIDVFIFNDNYEGPVETDDGDLRQAPFTQTAVPCNMCHVITEGQYSLVHSLEEEKQRTLEVDCSHPRLKPGPLWGFSFMESLTVIMPCSWPLNPSAQ